MLGPDDAEYRQGTCVLGLGAHLLRHRDGLLGQRLCLLAFA
jgi:hypothetical protein